MNAEQLLAPHQPGEAEKRLAKALDELDRERKAVRDIQRLLLPETLPEIPGFELSPYYKPSEYASGDYYDVVPLVDDQWGFVMADVAGHGVPAAVIMTVLRTLIHAELPSNRNKPAGEFLERINAVMSKTCLRNGMFVTVWAAVLDPESRQLTYASAGHQPPRLLREGHVLELGTTRGLPLGVDPVATYEDTSITLRYDDLVVIYTDGITEAMRFGADSRELFGITRLDRVLSKCSSEKAACCMQRVIRALKTFTNGMAPTDDQTMLILRASECASTSPKLRRVPLYRDDTAPGTVSSFSHIQRLETGLKMVSRKCLQRCAVSARESDRRVAAKIPTCSVSTLSGIRNRSP